MSSPQKLRVHLSVQKQAFRLEALLETTGTLAVVGPNGAGKTTLLTAILGAERVEQGRIELGNTVLLDTTASVNVPIEQRQLGYVPQDYALLPHLTASQNVLFAIRSANRPRGARQQAERAEAVLGELSLLGLAHRRPQELSGGEKQRLALARALAVSPRALLLDEPLAALDVHARRDVREFLAAYLRRVALPTLVVTHDPADAHALATTIAVLEGGRVTQWGTWAELRAAPASDFVQQLVRSAGPA